jgi:hypothetical protein
MPSASTVAAFADGHTLRSRTLAASAKTPAFVAGSWKHHSTLASSLVTILETLSSLIKLGIHPRRRQRDHLPACCKREHEDYSRVRSRVLDRVADQSGTTSEYAAF